MVETAAANTNRKRTCRQALSIGPPATRTRATAASRPAVGRGAGGRLRSVGVAAVCLRTAYVGVAWTASVSRDGVELDVAVARWLCLMMLVIG